MPARRTSATWVRASVSVPADVDGSHQVFQLVDLPQDSDDVQNVWINLGISDAVLAALDEE